MRGSVGSAPLNYASISGLRVAYYDSNSGKRNEQSVHNGQVPVMLIHGFCSMGATWHETFDQLAVRRRTIAIDLKGFGASDKPADGDYLIDTHARIIVQLMDALNIERAVLVGNSLGAGVALRVAQCWPERVAKLVLANPLVYHFDKLPLPARLVLAAYRAMSENLATKVVCRLARVPGLIESRLRHAHHLSATVTPERIAAYSAMLNDPPCQRAVAATLRTLDLRVLERHLALVNQHTLIIEGQYDRVIPPQCNAQLVNTLPCAERKIMPCGHAPQEEMPEQFVRLVNEFLETVSDEKSFHPTSLAR